MPSIDERIVAMSFENAKFEAGVAKTMASLSKLDITLQQVGKANSLAEIEKAAAKVTLQHPMSVLDRLKARFGLVGRDAAVGLGEIERAGSRVNLLHPSTVLDKFRARFSNLGVDAAGGFNEVERAGNRVVLDQPIRALDKVGTATANVGRNAAAGFNEIEKASNRVSLEGVNRAIDTVTAKFSTMQAAAAVALGNITSQAITKGASFAKSFSFGPLSQGLEEYQTNLKSIQTILANTEGQRVSGLAATNKALEELNKYSDQTIYNFSEMAKNIGTFTAAGVALPEATASIKGIANLAALSGSSSQQASTAMYQLSQAIAAGRVSLQDWNSVVNAGMGGAKFQQALMRTAENFGALEKGAVKIDKATGKATVNGQSFRESIMAKPGEQSWLTSEVLTKTLAQFTGDLSAAELAAQGFSEEQVKAIMATAKTAKAAATEVKTLPQVFEVAREAIGSGWSKTFQLIFGDFNESKKLFTSISTSLNSWINRVSDARNKMLGDWKKAGGRDALIEGMKNGLEALMSVLRPIKEAFREIFPATSGKGLADMTRAFRDFMDRLKIGPETAENLKRTFQGFFAVLSIGKQIVTGILSVIGKLFGAAGKGSGGFLAFTGSIGDWLTSVDRALKKGKVLKKFFDSIGDALAQPVKLIGDLAAALFGLGDGGKTEGVSKSFKNLSDALGPLNPVVETAKKVWDKFLESLEAMRDFIRPLVTGLRNMVGDIGQAFSAVGDVITDTFENMDFDRVFDIIQTGLIGGIFLAIKKALGGGISFEFGGKGFFDSLNQTMGLLNKNLLAIQKNIQASTMLKIAAAIGILAASATALSLVDPDRLASAMTAIAAGLGQLVGAMALITKIGGGAGFKGMALMVGQMNGIALGLILLAGAMAVLTLSILALSRLDWEELGKGLVGVGGALAAIGAAMKLYPPKGMLAIAASLGPIALALIGISLAMKIFSTLGWEEMAKGLVGVGGSLAVIGAVLARTKLNTLLLGTGPALIGLALGLGLLALAMKTFASMDLVDLGKGLGAVGASLVIVGNAVRAIPPGLAANAAGVLVLAGAMIVLAGAVKLFGGMDLLTLAKGLTAIGAAILVIGKALVFMKGTGQGSLALLAAAGALAILVPTIGILGRMKLMTIAKGLAAIVAAILAIGGAGALVAPALVAVGIGLAGVGAGLYLAGKGVHLLASGLVKLGGEGTKGVAVITASMAAFVALLPKMVIDFAHGLIQLVAEVAKLAPQLVTSFVKITGAIMDGIVQAAPKIANATIALLAAMLKVINDKAPELIEAGWKLLVAFLRGIENHIGEVVTAGGNIIRRFLSALADQLPRLITSGARVVVKFLEGIAQKLPNLITAGARVITKFLEGMTQNIPKIVPKAANAIAKFLTELAKQMPKLVTAGTRVILKFLEGIGNNIPKIVAKGVYVATQFVFAITRAMVHLADVGVTAMIRFMNGMADVIRNRSKEFGEAGGNLGIAIIQGMIKGMLGLVWRLYDTAKDIAQKTIKTIKDKIKPGSPSKVTTEYGKFITLGLAKGMQDAAPKAYASAADMAVRTIRGVKDTLKIQSPSKVMEELGRFVGQGFAKGIRGSSDEVTAAFSDMNQKLKDAIAGIRADILTTRDKLKDIGGDDGLLSLSDLGKILTVNDALRKQQAELSKLLAVRKLMTKDFVDEKKRLQDLAAAYSKLGEKLGAAQDTLKQKIQERNDAFQSYAEQFSKLPDINQNARNQLADYTRSLQNQIKAVAKFATTLQELRKLGLDDATYKKLLSEGTINQTFADQLLKGGATAVQGINTLTAQLATVSAGLGKDAALNLYQAGVDAAQGIVKGLESQMAAITKQVEKIAKAMVKALKKELKIKSPSEVFAEIARFSTEGLAKGFDASTKIAEDASTRLGNSTTAALNAALRSASDILGEDPSFNPVVTPVLDLTQVQKDAQQLGALTNVTPITAAASFDHAASISAAQAAAAQAVDSTTGEPSVTEIKFEQKNYSPKALTATEIYRQTKNQLAQVKSGIPLAS